jgi:hypothetical protein
MNTPTLGNKSSTRESSARESSTRESSTRESSTRESSTRESTARRSVIPPSLARLLLSPSDSQSSTNHSSRRQPSMLDNHPATEIHSGSLIGESSPPPMTPAQSQPSVEYDDANADADDEPLLPSRSIRRGLRRNRGQLPAFPSIEGLNEENDTVQIIGNSAGSLIPQTNYHATSSNVGTHTIMGGKNKRSKRKRSKRKILKRKTRKLKRRRR